MEKGFNRFKGVLCILVYAIFFSNVVFAQELNYEPKILLVTAHPDDDALFAGTVFKTTHLFDGAVDLAVITNGEGGFKYSTLGNYIYGKKLDEEETGRASLPGIRKKEVMAGGDIVGLRNYYFFDQVDREYSLDVENPLDTWDTELVVSRLRELIKKESYDFIFTMMATEDTHAHHKASALLTLVAVESITAKKRPLVLSTTILRNKSDSTTYSGLEGYPITDINRDIGPFVFDRTRKFGHKNQLDYNIIVNWVIAEHKSQGTMQQFMDEGKVEEYWYYSINPDSGVSKVRNFFKAVREAEVYTNPNNFEEDL